MELPSNTNETQLKKTHTQRKEKGSKGDSLGPEKIFLKDF